MIFICIGSFLSFGHASEEKKGDYYHKECLLISQYKSAPGYQINCRSDFHHFNGLSSSQYYGLKDSKKVLSALRIGSYNLFHPGTSKSGFKNYALMAAIIEGSFDLLSAQELLALSGRDRQSNQRVVTFLENAPRLLRKLEKRSRNGADVDQLIWQLKNDTREAPKLFRSPGYLKLLTELRKLDPSWSLILSPMAEGVKQSTMKELVGFYYRASIVRPAPNPYCRDYETAPDQNSFACLPSFSKDFMGKNYKSGFSRRPFLSNFQSGSRFFSLLSSHTIFNSPDDLDEKKRLLQLGFNVSDLSGMGRGIGKGNYARLVEMNLALKFMRAYRKAYTRERLLYMGDFNLELSNPFFKSLLEEEEGFVDWKTSLSRSRGGDDSPTNGLSRNFDHFVFVRDDFPECLDSDNNPFLYGISYYEGQVFDYIRNTYIVRGVRNSTGSYRLVNDAEKVMRTHERYLRNKLLKMNTIRRNKIEPQYSPEKIEKKLASFRRRIFLNQLDDRYFYNVFKELLSDHLPIGLSCSFNTKSRKKI